MRYEVVSIDKSQARELTTNRYRYAEELIATYGLGVFYTAPEVITMWEDYSEDYCAAWLNPNKESVEHVFGVKLREIGDE